MSIELVMLSNHLVLCRLPFSFCVQSFPSSGSFSMIPKYWSFSFSICPFREGLSPEAKERKTKINKWDPLINLKSFCTVKETIGKKERQRTEWEKIFANDMIDQGLVISRQSEWLSSKRTQMRNVGKDVEKREPFDSVDGNVNRCSYCGEQYKGFSKN